VGAEIDPDGAQPRQWSADAVAKRLAEAANVLSRLPHLHATAPSWPPETFERAQQAARWLGWLEPADAKLVWGRAQGCRWKLICWQFGISRATAHRCWQAALNRIVWRLNGWPEPKRCSRRYLLEQARNRTAASANM